MRKYIQLITDDKTHAEIKKAAVDAKVTLPQLCLTIIRQALGRP